MLNVSRLGKRRRSHKNVLTLQRRIMSVREYGFFTLGRAGSVPDELQFFDISEIWGFDYCI